MTHTGMLEDVSLSMLTFLEGIKATIQVEDVFYGDQELIPRFRALCVEPSEVTRELAGVGAGGQTLNTFTVLMYLYHGPYHNSQQNRQENEHAAALVQTALHDNLDLGGTVIHGFVVRGESGAANRGSLLAVHRLVWQGINKTLLGV
jgi:hypothetical protein